MMPCCLLTLIFALLRVAPAPFCAENSSLLIGSTTTAVTGSSSIRHVSDRAKCG